MTDTGAGDDPARRLLLAWLRLEYLRTKLAADDIEAIGVALRTGGITVRQAVAEIGYGGKFPPFRTGGADDAR